jgi:hypothetical protein
MIMEKVVFDKEKMCNPLSICVAQYRFEKL